MTSSGNSNCRQFVDNRNSDVRKNRTTKNQTYDKIVQLNINSTCGQTKKITTTNTQYICISNSYFNFILNN